jgi:hypothetical protein
MELIKHIFGFCGESHPNIITIILFIVVFKILTYKLYKAKFNNG